MDSGKMQLRSQTEQRGGRRRGREGEFTGMRHRCHSQCYPRYKNMTARTYPSFIDEAQRGWTSGLKHPEDWGCEPSEREAFSPMMEQGGRQLQKLFEKH